MIKVQYQHTNDTEIAVVFMKKQCNLSVYTLPFEQIL